MSSSGGICEPITIPVCQGLPYNQTIMPNLLGHANQREAVVKMSFFNSIVQAVCSVDIRLFVCMVYAPRCVAGEVQRPCKSFCQRAKTGCEELTNRFGVSWPNELLCDSFPDENCISVSNEQCVGRDQFGDRNVKNVFSLSLFSFSFTGRKQTRGNSKHVSKHSCLHINLTGSDRDHR